MLAFQICNRFFDWSKNNVAISSIWVALIFCCRFPTENPPIHTPVFWVLPLRAGSYPGEWGPTLRVVVCPPPPGLNHWQFQNSASFLNWREQAPWLIVTVIYTFDKWLPSFKSFQWINMAPMNSLYNQLALCAFSNVLWMRKLNKPIVGIIIAKVVNSLGCQNFNESQLHKT